MISQLKCVKHSVNLVEDDFVEIMIIAMVRLFLRFFIVPTY
jgi:hypothetical protein